MFRPNLWNILSVLFIGYILNSIWHLYTLYHPESCNPSEHDDCLEPALFKDGKRPHFQLRVYTSNRINANQLGVEVLKLNDFNLAESLELPVEVELPEKTRRNGTLWVHVFLLPNYCQTTSPHTEVWHLSQSSQITTYMSPKAVFYSLMSESETKKDRETENKEPKSNKPVTHLRSVLPLAAIAEPVMFHWDLVPSEVYHLLKLQEQDDEVRTRKYLPIFFVNKVGYRIKDLTEVTMDTTMINLTVKYEPVSIGKLRLLMTMTHSMSHLKQWGFSEKDMDEVKSIFSDTNFYFLSLTFSVAAVHILLDILAFKNDIHFWRGRRTMVGVSTKTLLWRCFSQLVIFFYLMDEETSLLVLIPTGIGTLIEFWKITKAFKIHITWRKFSPRVRFGSHSEDEVQTEEYDTQGMKYLGLLLVPLCLSGAVYSLLYTPHKSWASWFIQSMANGVYAFGFLFMLPQLFVNYKLKSVAHLPWRAFMYKAFNTFIDDLFAFIITMPNAHRLACFRDDVVFLVYLYQRYLYPVDKERVNEYGESFTAEEISQKKQDKKPAIFKKFKKEQQKYGGSPSAGSVKSRVPGFSRSISAPVGNQTPTVVDHELLETIWEDKKKN